MRRDGYDAETKQQFSVVESIMSVSQKGKTGFAQMWRASSLPFWRSQGCLLRNCCARTNCKLALSHWNSTTSVEKCVVKNQVKNGTELIGLSMRTMHVFLFCLCMNLWLRTKLLSVYCHCRPHLMPRDHHLFLKLKMILKWRQFNGITMIVAKLRYAFCWVSNIALCTVTWSQSSLCVVPGRPVWRGQHWTEGRYCLCGEADSVQKPFCLNRQFYRLMVHWCMWHWDRVWFCQSILKQGCRSPGWLNFILWVPNICGP